MHRTSFTLGASFALLFVVGRLSGCGDAPDADQRPTEELIRLVKEGEPAAALEAGKTLARRGTAEAVEPMRQRAQEWQQQSQEAKEQWEDEANRVRYQHEQQLRQKTKWPPKDDSPAPVPDPPRYYFNEAREMLDLALEIEKKNKSKP